MKLNFGRCLQLTHPMTWDDFESVLLASKVTWDPKAQAADPMGPHKPVHMGPLSNCPSKTLGCEALSESDETHYTYYSKC